MKRRDDPPAAGVPTADDLLRLIDAAVAGDEEALRNLFAASRPVGYALAKHLRWGAPPSLEFIRKMAQDLDR